MVPELSAAEEIDVLPSGVFARFDGVIERVDEPPEGLVALARDLIAPALRDGAIEAMDGSCRYLDERWRYSAFRSREGGCLILRRLPGCIPSLSRLGFGEGDEILSLTRSTGLLLFCGPTGAGKSTTMAATVAHLIEAHGPMKVVTIESPVEYTHENPLVLHREVGLDVAGFGEGIREAMRQTPDLIVVGEIRERDAAHAAVKAGLSGHRVFATLHAHDIEDAFSRMWSFMDDSHDDLLAEAVSGVVVQHIARSGKNSLPVYETLHNTPQVRGHLRSGPKGLTYITQECFVQRRPRLKDRAKTMANRLLLPKEALSQWIEG